MVTADKPTADQEPKARREILQAAGRPYSWLQVLAGAYFRGAAADLHAEEAEAMAAMGYAKEEGFEVPEEAGEAGDAFRVEHNLITGEEMERWLDHCGIALEEFNAHFAARSLAARFAGELEAIRRDYAPAAEDVVKAMWAATILSGSFEAFTIPFARRVALRAGTNAAVDAAAAESALREGAPRVPEPLRTPDLVGELAALEVLYAADERVVAAEERCAAVLRDRAFQLTRIVVAGAVFPTLDQANEVYQGVTADGLALEELARLAGIEPILRTIFAEDAPEGAVPLLSALPGRVLEPEAVEGGFLVRQLRRRIEPAISDPDVAARVRGRLLDAHFDALVGLHVTWGFDPWLIR